MTLETVAFTKQPPHWELSHNQFRGIFGGCGKQLCFPQIFSTSLETLPRDSNQPSSKKHRKPERGQKYQQPSLCDQLLGVKPGQSHRLVFLNLFTYFSGLFCSFEISLYFLMDFDSWIYNYLCIYVCECDCSHTVQPRALKLWHNIPHGAA